MANENAQKVIDDFDKMWEKDFGMLIGPQEERTVKTIAKIAYMEGASRATSKCHETAEEYLLNQKGETKMNKAFTMIELIFVIVIIGIIAATVIPKVEKAKEDKVQKQEQTYKSGSSQDPKYWK